MIYYNLKTHNCNTILHEGYFSNFVECLEDAVRKNINLKNIDLRGKNLSNANIDGARMQNALFDNANLTGANMSECNISNSNFQNCAIYNTCFSYSDINRCDFSGASFGASLIEGCNIEDCIFSTMSCFDLDFTLTQSMQGCYYREPNGDQHSMFQPPMILKGFFSTPIVIFDQTVKIGNNIFPDDIIPSLLKMVDHVMNKACQTRYSPNTLYKREHHSKQNNLEKYNLSVFKTT